MGATGSGKSHLSRILAKLLKLQVHELDDLRDCLPGGQLDAGEFVQRVEFITSGNAWIMDGHYLAVRHIIWQRADTVVFLNYPIYLIFTRLMRRFLVKQWSRIKRGSGEYPTGTSSHNNSARRAGSWNQRWNRLLKTFRERQDYGRTLHSPDYDRLNIIELNSKRATREWIQVLQLNA